MLGKYKKAQLAQLDSAIVKNINSSFSFSDYIFYTIFYACIVYNALLIIVQAIDILQITYFRVKNKEGFIQHMLSVLYKFYSYLIFIPSISTSFQYLQNSLSYFNISVALIAQFVCDFHDFDYNFNPYPKDSLSRRNLKWINIFNSAFIVVVTLNHGLLKVDIQDILFVVLSIKNLIIHFIYRVYLNKTIRLNNLVIQIYLLMWSFYFLVFRFFDLQFSILVSLAIMFPCVFKISQHIECVQHSIQNFLPSLENFSQIHRRKKIIFYLQDFVYLFKHQQYVEYIQNFSSIILEQVFCIHQLTCLNQATCFCQSKFETKQEIWDNIIDNKLRKQIFLNHIQSMIYFCQSAQFSNSTAISFFYINFLIDTCSAQAPSYYQLQLLKQRSESKMNSSKKIYLNYLLNKAKQIFNEKNKQYNFCKKTLVFEKQVKETQDLYETCLNQKLKLLQVINSDEINIKTLFKTGTTLLQQRNQLKNQIRNLSLINKYNPELKEIINGFLMSLSFLDSKDNLVNFSYNSSNFSNNSSESIYSIELRDKSETTYFKNESIKSYYNTSVVFFSIQQGERGKILATSNNFESIFGFQNVISQDVSMIFPSIMIQKFEQRIENMTNTLNQQNKQEKQVKMLLCRTNIGLGIPVIPRMFLDYLPHLDMFGMIIRLEVSNNTNYFAIYSPQNFQLNLVNTVFYSEFMKKYFKVQEISNVYFSKLVPISIFLKNSRILKDSPFIDTLCFLPSKQNNQDSYYFKTPLTFQDIFEQKISQISLYQFDFYKIRFYVKEVENYEDELLLCEVFSLKRIRKHKEIQENIQHLKNQIDSLILEAEQLNFLCTLQVQTSKPSIARQDEKILQNRYNNIKQNKNIRKGSSNDDGKYEGSQKDLLSTNYMMQGNKTIQKLLDHDKMQDTFLEKKTCYINELLSPTTSNQFSGILLSPAKVTMNDDKIKIFDDDHNQYNYQESYYSSDKYLNYQINQKQNISNIKYWQNQKSIETDIQNQYQEILVDMPSIQQFQDINNNNNMMHSNSSFHDQSYLTPNKGMNRFNYHEIAPYLVENEQKKSAQNKQQIFFSNNNQFDKQDSSNFSDIWSKQSNSFDTDDSDLENKRSRRTHVTQKTGSNQSITQESLKHIYNSVLKKQRNAGLLILNIFGIASLLLIIGLISIDFVLIIQTFQKAKIDYQFISFPMDLQSLLSQIMYRVYIIGINDQKIIPDLVKAWPQYYQENVDFIHKNQAEAIKIYDSQQNADFQIATYFERLAATSDTWILKKDYYSFKGMNTTVKAKQQYFLLHYVITHYMFSQKIYNAYNNLATIYDNFDNFNQIITQLQSDIYESSVGSLNQILENTKTLMIICIILALLIVCAIIPLNAIIQTQREIVLKLFATIQPLDIQNMENACLNSLQAKERTQTKKRLQSTLTLIGQVSQHDLSFKKIPVSSTKVSIGQNLFKSKNQTTAFNEKKIIQANKPKQDQIVIKNAPKDGKKKNISLISSLPKFSLHILIFGIIGFISIVSQPIINFFLIKNFISEGDLNIQMLSILSTVKSQFCGTIFFSYANIYVKQSNATSLVYNKNFFDPRLPDVFGRNDKALNDLYLAESDSNSRVRYNNNQYDNFFYQVLKGDVCKTFDNNQQYIDDSKYYFNQTKCNSLQSQILNQGFLVSAKYFLDLFKDLFEITSVQDFNTRQSLLITWEEQYKIKKLSQFTDLMITVISVLSDFITQQGLDYLNFSMRLQITLAITQVISLILVFYFGWMTFYNSTHNSMNDTVQLLSLIDINILATNSYTSSYLKSRK
ncbi:hypothetical protein ABPG74_003584 [Tetrahymena malaccensis]